MQIATRSLRLEHFKAQQWEHLIESDFFTHKAQFDQVIYSLLRCSQPELMQELFFRITTGEQSFADLAREYSEGAEANTGGLLGPVPLTQPHPAIGDRLKHSQPGQLLPPFKVGEWYILLRLEQRIAAQLDASIRQHLLDQRFETWLKPQLQQVSWVQPPAPVSVPTIAAA
jgi:parvulin-like peptidyl-prolyl isomerase